MNTLRNTGSLLSALPLLSALAGAQTITPLVVEGDVIANGTVTSISNVDVNDSGDWLVELDTDNATTTLDNAVIFNGAMIHQEGTAMGFPASHSGAWVYDSYVDSMDINDNGDRLLLFNVADVNGVLPDHKLVLWTNGSTGVTYPILEDGVTPATVAGEPSGAVWDSIAEVWQNNNNTIVIAGRTNTDSDDMMAVITHDGAGTILSQTAFIMDNVIHSVAYPGSTGTHADTVQTIENSKREFAINDAGQKMFHVDDQSYGPGGTPNYTTVDSHYYIDLQEIAWEADDAPTAGTWPYNHMSSAEVDINDNGTWVAAWDDDNTDSTYDGFILVNGALFVQEGDVAPGVAGGFLLEGTHFTNSGVQISDSGDVTWTAEWSDPDTAKDRGLYRNHMLLAQEGVTMIGGLQLEYISSSTDAMAVSDNGRYIIREFRMAGGLEGAYLVEVDLGNAYCFGDNSGTACPCGNAGGAGEGCANGTGAGGILDASGTSSIALADFVLETSQCPANQPGLLFQGDVATNSGAGLAFGDGLRCAGGAVIRLQVVVSDGSGNSASTLDIGAKGGVAAGDTRYYQFWYRDPLGSPCAALFNLSNGLELTWGL